MLYLLKERKAYSILELLIVIGVISVLIAIGGSLSSKFFKRRSVDNISYQIGSLLNQIKLKAARQGLEYQLTLNYDNAKNSLELINERGDSNRNSVLYQQTGSHTISVPENYTVSLPRGNSEHSFNFNPNGTLGGAAGSIRIRPLNEEADIKKCGRIVISPFGRIRTVIGKWDFNSEDCEGIGNNQQNPS